MRHVTFNALRVVLGTFDAYIYDGGWHLACDWSDCSPLSGWNYDLLTVPNADLFLKGDPKVKPPTCPNCAVLWDMALELRDAG